MIVIIVQVNCNAQVANPIYGGNWNTFTQWYIQKHGIVFHKLPNCKLSDNYFKKIKLIDNYKDFAFGPIFKSRDKQCQFLYSGSNILPLDSLIGFPKRKYHAKAMIRLSNKIRDFYEHEVDTVEYGNYETVISGKMPKEYFNATEMCFSDIKILTQCEKYNNCTIVTINNANKMMIHIYLLLTDKGKKNVIKYINMLKSNIWFTNHQYDQKWDPIE
ncbi:hypothetical protein EYV94_25755 [Puteibacter caeruleilacunae]|nr:hypothetical protein EYV94_25755 [Puteibacter caeruleilacunae]